MNEASVAVTVIAGAYLIGSISFAVVVSKIYGLDDPRTYGSGNPAYGDNCPGLFAIPGLPVDPSLICNVGGGVGGPLLNAPRTIDVPREAAGALEGGAAVGVAIQQLTRVFDGLFARSGTPALSAGVRSVAIPGLTTTEVDWQDAQVAWAVTPNDVPTERAIGISIRWYSCAAASSG